MQTRLLGLLLLAVMLSGVGRAQVIDIPRLANIKLGEGAKTWGDRGFRVETMVSDKGEFRAPENLDAKFRLGWDDSGLLALVTVRDDQIAVALDESRLWSKDSVEIFVATALGAPRFHQLSIGALPYEDGRPRLALVMKGASPAPGAAPSPPPQAKAAVTRTSDGYQVEARIPWSDVGVTPKLGTEVGIQIFVNDVDQEGPRLKVGWFPSAQTSFDSRAMMRVRLADKPSPAVVLAAGRSLDGGRPRLDLVGAAGLVGQLATARMDGKVVGSAIFQPVTGRAVAALLPPAGVIEIAAPTSAAFSVDCRDFPELLDRAISAARPVFSKSVFSGEKFPSIGFRQPAEAEKAFGGYTFATTFYDALYHEVKTAATPGRYGAVVRVTTSNGVKFTRYLTIYRSPGKLWDPPIHFGSTTFPPYLGLDPAVVAERGEGVDGFLTDVIENSTERDNDAAVFFAGMAELKAGGETPCARNGPEARDQAWWFGLKKKLGELRGDYVVHLPAGYEKDQTKVWPLLLFLHGSGERGENPKILQGRGPLAQAEKDPNFPFIVIAPQCSSGGWWSPPELMQLLDDVEAKYRVDRSRVCLTGLSMGGYGSWALGLYAPQRFAAIVPICGGGDPTDAARLKQVPIWVFHGAKDDTVPIERSQAMVDALKKAGNEAKFTIYPEAGHDSWTQAYAELPLYEWLEKQRTP